MLPGVAMLAGGTAAAAFAVFWYVRHPGTAAVDPDVAVRLVPSRSGAFVSIGWGF
jgi:hypothetical protein